MKGHILILSVNILFAVSMPVFKYLLTADVSPEAITIMRATFACIMVWLASLFMPKEKVLPKDLRTLFICALCGVGINQWLFAAAILKEPITAFGVLILIHYSFSSFYLNRRCFLSFLLSCKVDEQ
jgi:drug/metabolite transporter (DMT)-like permease